MAKSDLKEFARLVAEKRPRREIEHTFTARSGRVFVIKALTGRDHEAIDGSVEIGSEGFAIKMQYRRIIAALVSIDGIAVPDLESTQEVEQVLEMLDGSELDELLGAFSTAFEVKGEMLKNSSAPPDGNVTPMRPPSGSRGAKAAK